MSEPTGSANLVPLRLERSESAASPKYFLAGAPLFDFQISETVMENLNVKKKHLTEEMICCMIGKVFKKENI